MNVLFEEACRLEKSMRKDTQLMNEECENMRLVIEKLFLKMKESNPSLMTQQL